MLAYSILILEKVSFDSVLFSKELEKAIPRLTPSEIRKLGNWLFEHCESNAELKQFKTYFVKELDTDS